MVFIKLKVHVGESRLGGFSTRNTRLQTQKQKQKQKLHSTYA